MAVSIIWGTLFVGLFTRRSLPFGVYIEALIFGNSKVRADLLQPHETMTTSQHGGSFPKSKALASYQTLPWHIKKPHGSRYPIQRPCKAQECTICIHMYTYNIYIYIYIHCTNNIGICCMDPSKQKNWLRPSQPPKLVK